MKTLLAKKIFRKVMTETVMLKNERFRISTGLTNGSRECRVDVLTTVGWSFLMNEHDVSFDDNGASYVSSDDDREVWMRSANKALKEGIKKLHP
jgi:hypothetical protein